MAFNPFIGRDQTWLEARLKEAQDELSGGMSTISGNLGEASFGRIMTIGPMKRIEMILAALNRISPSQYPIDDASVPTRTVMQYRGAI